MFHSNYGRSSYHFLNKARYWSKITICFTQPCIVAAAREVPVAITFGMVKPEWCRYPMVKKV